VAELDEVMARLADPEVIADSERLRVAGRRYKELEEVLAVGRPLQAAHDDLVVARELSEIAEGDERESMRAEMETIEAEIVSLEDRLRALLLPRDPNDGRNVIVEIRGAEGGEEANLFARDLYDMYQAFSLVRGWKVELLEARDSDMGGYSDVVFLAKGDDAWTRLKGDRGRDR